MDLIQGESGNLEHLPGTLTVARGDYGSMDVEETPLLKETVDCVAHSAAHAGDGPERIRARPKVGYLPQEFGMYENMTAYEFLDYLAILKGIFDAEERDERVSYVLKSVHLDEKRNNKIGSFSGGMKQRVGIALTLLHLPRILVVDEPTAGLDPRERIRFRNLLVELSKDRIVIFSL